MTMVHALSAQAHASPALTRTPAQNVLMIILSSKGPPSANLIAKRTSTTVTIAHLLLSAAPVKMDSIFLMEALIVSSVEMAVKLVTSTMNARPALTSMRSPTEQTARQKK